MNENDKREYKQSTGKKWGLRSDNDPAVND